MKTSLTLITLVLVASCASSGSGSAPVGRGTETVRVQGAGTLRMSAPTTTASVASLAHPIEQVWAALPAVYDSLAIPVTTHDAAGRTIGNSGLKVRARLGKTSLSRFLDCGNTQMGPSADSYEVHLIVNTRLTPAAGGGTTVETVLDATARPINFAQAPSRCSSKGELEKRVATLLGMTLAASPGKR